MKAIFFHSRQEEFVFYKGVLTTVIGTAPMRSVDTVPGLGTVARRVILHWMMHVIVWGARHVYRMAVHTSSRCLRHALDKRNMSAMHRERQ